MSDRQSSVDQLYLVKYGELALRGENRLQFEIALERNIRNALRAKDTTRSGESGGPRVWREHGRIFVHADDPVETEGALESTFGIASFALAERSNKSVEEVEAAAMRVAARHAGELRSFKIEVRRLDKSFPLSSYEIACRLGDRIREAHPGLVVDVHHPELTIRIEIRELAYVYGPERDGPRGLPLGTSGSGLLLLSGGIDSPVAGYLMGFRGLRQDAVYFHTPPYTSEEALGKVLDICRMLQRHLPGMGLWVVPFTAVSERIREERAEREVTLLMRACMMRIADLIAVRSSAHALVTGESLGQVASQTPQSIHFTGSTATLPVLRPLIGMDKDQIIMIARRIGTYEISILPYSDCCSLFAPRRPLIKPMYEEIRRSYLELGMEPLLQDAAAGAEWRMFGSDPASGSEQASAVAPETQA